MSKKTKNKSKKTETLTSGSYDGSIRKLIDFLRGYVEPQAIKDRADANSYKIKKITEAKAQAKIISAHGKSLAKSIKSIDTESAISKDIYNRMTNRLGYEEINKQINLESISQKTISYLPKDVSAEPVNADWRTRFLSMASKISDENMQEIWAKILAGEIAKPKSFSLRTLATLQSLNEEDAKTFEKIASLCLENGLICTPTNKRHLGLDKFGITYGEILLLRDANLLMPHDELYVELAADKEGEKQINLSSYDKKHKFIITIRDSVAIEEKRPHIEIGCIQLSNAGIELMRLVSQDMNADYLKWLEDSLSKIPIVEKVILVTKIDQKSRKSA